MKRSLLILVAVLFISVTFGQTYNLISGQSTINYLKSVPGGSSTVSQEIEVKIVFLGPAPPNNINLNFVINHPYPIPSFAPAIVNIPVGGYVIPKEKFGTKADTFNCKINIRLNATPLITANEFFDIQLGAPAVVAANQYHRVVIESTSTEDAEAAEKKKKKGLLSNIMLLNAYNFDFGSTSLASNYVGHLNLFAPSISGDNHWGFNTGIMKINYGQKDTSSSNGNVIKENVFINPFDTVAVGLKYLKQLNSYKTELRNEVWSFYVQPNYQITNAKKSQHIYVHAHLELLASKWSSTTTVTTVNQDTGVLTSLANGLVLKGRYAEKNTYTVNSLSGYFGTGFTFDLKPWNGSSFFFQPTVGLTSNTPSPASIDIGSTVRSSSAKRDENPRTWRWFYLVRANYRQTLSKDATVIVGMDIRGLFPLYAPQYAAYVGLNLGLDSILGLIGGKKSE